MPDTPAENRLFAMLETLRRREERGLSPRAALSAAALRRHAEARPAYRQPFALDADRILHSRAYTRYIDKTQVFSLVANDHISHRVLHVQLVSRIARTIGRFLCLNEDLLEAIALGHDIGHPPFGHPGEEFLSELCRENGLLPFQHNVQSVRFLDRLERGGRGWNLTIQTLDGILCHDGESHSATLTPGPEIDCQGFDEKLFIREQSPGIDLAPATAEGCVVRLADVIAYVGRDIEDAIVLGLIGRGDIPAECRRRLGDTNGEIVYHLVTDIIMNSQLPESRFNGDIRIGFSEEIAEALRALRAFNSERIYHAPETRRAQPRIRACYQALFAHHLARFGREGGETQSEAQAAARARDFIAGMTDDYFLRQVEAIGCAIPEKR
ncbi:MAG: HD domain-containing protein [Desulfobulbaceae bacterium]|jgi:dGTPase|nr:HD domain-containing protein [Desulfobulbaceae bacterium]